MSCEPVIIEIEPDCINSMNFPGIDRSISSQTIAEGNRFVSRYYRNRRLGEFLIEEKIGLKGSRTRQLLKNQSGFPVFVSTYRLLMLNPLPRTSRTRLITRKLSGSMAWIIFSMRGSSRLEMTLRMIWVSCLI